MESILHIYFQMHWLLENLEMLNIENNPRSNVVGLG